MWIRMATLPVAPGKRDDVRQAFHYTMAPILGQRQGLISSYLLEPRDEGEPVLLYTAWNTHNDLLAFMRVEDLNEVGIVLDPLLTAPMGLQTYEAIQ
jgi:heme-degrading monooxygenase HmoA